MLKGEYDEALHSYFFISISVKSTLKALVFIGYPCVSPESVPEAIEFSPVWYYKFNNYILQLEQNILFTPFLPVQSIIKRLSHH
jgi:hypothetical protein